MALINCPECGKANVSDSAISCPECGYAIKEHFDNIKLVQKREQEEKALQEKKEAEERHRKETEGERQRETITRLENIIKKSSNEIRNSTIVLIVSVLLSILLYSIGLGELILFSGLAIFISAVFLISGVSEKNSAVDDLAAAQSSMHEYEELQEKKIKAIGAQMRADALKNAAKHPKCPMCGSTNTERISTLNRTVSVVTFGFASSKIGKQYQCKNCKHKW